MKKISTSKLAENMNLNTQEAFLRLEKLGLIHYVDKKRKLTEKGTAAGGDYAVHPTHGEYIVWPEDWKLSESAPTDATSKKKSSPLISSQVIGKEYNLSSQKVNAVLSELGWLEKALKGWKVTKQGIAKGGYEIEHQPSGAPYVKWPKSILQSSDLKRTLAELSGSQQSEAPASTNAETKKPTENNFREKFPAKHRATDGHVVRSKAEMLIDNWLYMAEIVHAYERKLPIEEEVYCDFYIPKGKVYIEYWGYENDPKYLARKKAKQEIYKKYDFNLIELNDEEVLNLDDILPRLLLKHDIKSY